MKKIILAIAALIIASISYNPHYWGWHCWIKWKMPFSDELSLVPSQLNIPIVQYEKVNWADIDLLEFKFKLPSNPIEVKSFGTTGILLKFKDFSIASVKIVSGRNINEIFEPLNKLIDQDKEYAGFKVTSYFDHLVGIHNITPNELNYFQGSKKTSIKIQKLIQKGSEVANVTEQYVFDTPNVKGIYKGRSDGKNLLYLVAPNEAKGLMFVFNFLIQDDKEKMNIVSQVISSIIFSENFPEESEIKQRIEKVAELNKNI